MVTFILGQALPTDGGTSTRIFAAELASFRPRERQPYRTRVDTKRAR